MNDKTPAAAETAAVFEPAAAGWQAVTGTPFGQLTGPIWRHQDGGRLRFGFTVEPKHLNRIGNLHGGMLMTLADQAMAMTGRHATGGKPHATMELNIQFIDGAHLGEFVEAKCNLIRQTRSVLFLETKIYVGERLVASANGIWKIFGEP